MTKNTRRHLTDEYKDVRMLFFRRYHSVKGKKKQDVSQVIPLNSKSSVPQQNQKGILVFSKKNE